KRSAGKAVYFQPLYLLETEIQHRENRDIQQLRNLRLADSTGQNITDYHKQSISIFLADVMHRSLRENEPDQALFDFVWHALQLFDNSDKSSVNFHLFFLSHLMKYLGFSPGNTWSENNAYLNMDSGMFVNRESINSACLNERESRIIDRFTHFSASEIPEKGFSNKDRKLGLDAMMSYYEQHIPDFGYLKSYDILKTLYSE
ncbi:MAG TPA: DNA repair protein RecO C-terminal domain-containing protein, partial [Bacteroidales bacterium]|nr:DNA repair protein RecO C-terminal domain-containing protein [Bacteroidales bacterium]